jgi:hypothetical protein
MDPNEYAESSYKYNPMFSSSWVLTLSTIIVPEQVYFHKIPDEVIDSLVSQQNTPTSSNLACCAVLLPGFSRNEVYILECVCTTSMIWFLIEAFHFCMFQIEEGNVFYVAGGLLVEHPLTSPLVESIVSCILTCSGSRLDYVFLCLWNCISIWQPCAGRYNG